MGKVDLIMPRYSYFCARCDKDFDELHMSFGAAERAERAGVRCPDCGKKSIRSTDPAKAMAGGAFRRYGLSTYGVA